MSVANQRSVSRVILRVAALDAAFVIAGVIGWSMVNAINPWVLALVYLVRGGLSLLHLWRLLAPVRRFHAAGDRLHDALVLEADDLLQRGIQDFLISYPLGFVLALVLSFAISVSAPELGIVSGWAEWMTVGLGALTCAILTYAFMLVLMGPLLREHIAAVSEAMMARRLGASRSSRSLETDLRRFLTAIVTGLLCVSTVIAGKARSDAIRERAIVDQTARAALALAELRASGVVADPGLEIVDRSALPAIFALEPGSGVPSVGVFDPSTERAHAAVAIGEDRWLLAEGEVEDQLGLFIALMLAMTAIMGAVTHVGARTLGRSLVQPLVDLRVTTRVLAETGVLDQLERTAPQHNDEIGALVRDFNEMLEMLEELVQAARAVAAGDLRVEIDHPGDLHDAFRAMVVQLHEMVGRLSTTTHEVTSVTTEIQASMHELDEAATQLTRDVEQTSGNTQVLAEAALAVSEAASGVLTLAERSSSTADTMAETFSELARQVVGIGELLEVIDGIADSSDLLALNGALEATRAGEAGRSFALVASEMRRLAERVSATLEDVRGHVDRIQRTSSDAAKVTGEGRSLAAETARVARQITTLTAAQHEAATQASAATQAMARFVLGASEGVVGVRASTEGLRQRVEELEQITQTFRLHSGGAER